MNESWSDGAIGISEYRVDGETIGVAQFACIESSSDGLVIREAKDESESDLTKTILSCLKSFKRFS